MKLDDVTKEAIVEIHNKLVKEGIIISIQEIGEIVESQLIVGNLAFKKGLEIRLPLFGSFVRKHGLEKSKAAAELNKLKDSLTKEEFDLKVLEAKMLNKDKTKKRRKEMTRVTFKGLKETVDLVKIKNRFDKVL